jgi:hypothetical protein
MLTREDIETVRVEIKERVLAHGHVDTLCDLAIAGLGAQGATKRRRYAMRKGAPWAYFSDWPDADYVLASDLVSLTAELEEARKEREGLQGAVTALHAKNAEWRDKCAGLALDLSTLQAANRAMGELLGQCQRHMHHCDESDSKILELRIKQALAQSSEVK